jgi:hypothetical protein
MSITVRTGVVTETSAERVTHPAVGAVSRPGAGDRTSGGLGAAGGVS